MSEDDSVLNISQEEQPVKKIKRQSFWEKRSGRLFITVIIGLIVSFILALVQHRYVQYQINKTYEDQLDTYAKQVSKELVVTDKWQLEQYRRAAIQVPQWIIVEDSGLLIDVEGVVPGFYDQVELVDKNIFITPKNITTDTGESWRLFGRKLSDGYLVVGIKTLHSDTETDSRLKTNASKFGLSVAQAQLINSKDVEYEIDYAVVDASNKLVLAWGGVPLMLTQSFVDLSKEGFQTISNDQHSYLILIKALTSQSGKHVGRIVVPLDTTKGIQALSYINTYNYGILIIATVIVLILIGKNILKKYSNTVKIVTIEQAIMSGESTTIEFKESYHWNIEYYSVYKTHNKEMVLIALRAISSFLNAGGGQLFIGIAETRNGIEPLGILNDLNVLNCPKNTPIDKKKDLLLLNLRDHITTSMGVEVSQLVDESILEYKGKFILVVTIKASSEPIWVKWQTDLGGYFYIRDGPRTKKLEGREAYKYIKKHWAKLK